jgi:hypothetical protein
MLMIKAKQEAGALCECEEHGWMQDRGDPHARSTSHAAIRRPGSRRTRPLSRSRRC